MKNLSITTYNRLLGILLTALFMVTAGSGLLQAQGQMPTEEPLVRVLSSDARSLALAEANGSDISDLSISVLNPAGFSLINKQGVAYNSFHSWSNSIYSLDLGYRSSSFRGHSFMVSGQYLSTGLNKVNYLGSPEFVTPELERAQVMLGYSYAPSPVFSMGFVGRGYTAWNDFDATEHVNFDFGLIYAPTNKLSYSLVLRGVGYGLGYDILGNGSTVIVNRRLEERLEYGASMYFPTNSDRQIVTLTAATEKSLRSSDLYYRVGLEVLPFDFMAVRGGFLNGAGETGFSTGLGFNLSGFTLSYSVAPDSRAFDMAHQIELLFNF